MKQVSLYSGGGVSLSPVYAEERSESNYVRLIADDGMMLVKGEQSAVCVDVLETDVADWSETEYAEPELDIDNAEAFAIIFGGGAE